MPKGLHKLGPLQSWGMSPLGKPVLMYLMWTIKTVYTYWNCHFFLFYWRKTTANRTKALFGRKWTDLKWYFLEILRASTKRLPIASTRLNPALLITQHNTGWSWTLFSKARDYQSLSKVPNVAYPLVPISRQVWSQSPLVRAIGGFGACTPRVFHFRRS